MGWGLITKHPFAIAEISNSMMHWYLNYWQVIEFFVHWGGSLEKNKKPISLNKLEFYRNIKIQWKLCCAFSKALHCCRINLRRMRREQTYKFLILQLFIVSCSVLLIGSKNNGNNVNKWLLAGECQAMSEIWEMAGGVKKPLDTCLIN